MSFTEVGAFTVGPTDSLVKVGSFDLEEGDDTIWFEVQRTSPDQGWPWSYGLLSWRSSFGLELGTCKAIAPKKERSTNSPLVKSPALVKEPSITNPGLTTLPGSKRTTTSPSAFPLNPVSPPEQLHPLEETSLIQWLAERGSMQQSQDCCV